MLRLREKLSERFAKKKYCTISAAFFMLK